MSAPENEPTPPGVRLPIDVLDRAAMRLDVRAHTTATYVTRHGGRLDLQHAGRASEGQMHLRLERWLERHPGHEAREQQQACAYIMKYTPIRYGWKP